MKRNIVASVLLIPGLLLLSGIRLSAQQDQEVRNKQSELKLEFNDAQEKNQIIRTAAQDKPRPTTGRRRGTATTGYDYTQVKGYTLRSMDTRLDQIFAKAGDLGFFDEKYQADGTFQVAGRKGVGSAQIRKIEVYYVEATPEEQQNLDANPFEIIEVRVEKLETLPPQEATEGEGEDMSLGLGTGAIENVAKAYSLSGNDLRTLLHLSDESLYDDILARRSQEQPIALPADLFLPDKRGPFLVQTNRDLETTAGRFADFWNPRDTLATIILPQTTAASGPLSDRAIPVFYPDESKIRLKNPNKEALKISDATFVGENAPDFVLRSKLPLMLDPKGGQNDKFDLQYEYIGQSPYEARATLMVEAREAKLTQGFDIIANPGRFPADIVVIDASLDKIELRSPSRSSFAADWKLSYVMGSDEISMPRWASGISSLNLGYKHEMSIGVVLPMNMSTDGLPAPLAFQNRLLNSPMGYNVNFDFTFGFPFSLGGNLVVANKFDGQDAYEHLVTIRDYPVLPGQPDYNNDFFHISTIAQVYYPIMFKDRPENPSVAFRINIGGAFMQIQRDHVVQPGETEKLSARFTEKEVGKMVTLERHKDIVDIYFRIAFINLAAKNNYGLGIQYFAGRMMADAWLELTDWFRVEAKYSFLLRDRYIWESESNYFLITPRFRFGLPSIFN